MTVASMNASIKYGSARTLSVSIDGKLSGGGDVPDLDDTGKMPLSRRTTDIWSVRSVAHGAAKAVRFDKTMDAKSARTEG